MPPLMSEDFVTLIQAFAEQTRFRKGSCRLLEYGTGGSTAYWCRNGMTHVTSVEASAVWGDRVQQELRKEGIGDDKISYNVVPVAESTLEHLSPLGGVIGWSDKYSHIWKDYSEFAAEHCSHQRFDIMIIDGHDRKRCLLNSLHLLDDNGLIIVHDINLDQFDQYDPIDATVDSLSSQLAFKGYSNFGHERGNQGFACMKAKRANTNAAIFCISARENLLPTCLVQLRVNYNCNATYPVHIFYHGDRYDARSTQVQLMATNPVGEMHFHKLVAQIPAHLKEADLFYNLKNNTYARNFGKARIGYLHASDFWINFSQHPSLQSYQYLMRIDDDSWFKQPIQDLFGVLHRSNALFGTAYTWNHFHTGHQQTREGLYEWIRMYVNKHKIHVKNEQLRKSLHEGVENSTFHTLPWSCGNCNVYNMAMFQTPEWRLYIDEFNKFAGHYRYRWTDIEVIGLFAYMHNMEPALVDFDLRAVGLYEPQLPGTLVVRHA